MTWDVLICSIEHRTDLLTELLTELERQRVPGFGVIVARDNLELAYGPKCQLLLESSKADYTSYIDDDDMVAPDYVSRIMEALETEPDYVGFKVKYTVDGEPQMPVTHSLQYVGWANAPDHLTRDIVHFNPVKREIGITSEWEGGYAADGRWCDGLRGKLQNEVFLDDEMYYYQFTTTGSFTVPREPLTESVPRPDFDWVTWL